MFKSFSLAIVLLFSISQIIDFRAPLAYGAQPGFLLQTAVSTMKLRNNAGCSGGNDYAGSIDIYLIGQNGFNGIVFLSWLVAPTGPTVSLDTTSVYLSPDNPYGEVTATLRLSQEPTASEYSFYMTGRSGTSVNNLNVTAVPDDGPYSCPAAPYPTEPKAQPYLFYAALIALTAVVFVIAAVLVRKGRTKRVFFDHEAAMT